MKKIAVIYICAVMLLSLAAMPVSASGTEVLSGGGFEERGMWTLPAEGEYVSEGVYSGAYSLKLESMGNCYAHQQIYLVGGEQYDLSLYAKSNIGAKAHVKFEFYNKNTYVGEIQLNWNTSSQWSLLTYTIDVPETANRATILIRLIGGGDIYYDNVSLRGLNPDDELKKKHLSEFLSMYPEKEAIGAENLMYNGGFENITADDKPEGWSAYKNWGEGYVSVETENVHSGNYALKIATTNGGNPFASYTINSVDGGATYQLVIWYKGKVNGENSRLSVKFEGYNTIEGYCYENNMYYLPDISEWSRAVYNVTLPENCDRVSILPRCYSPDGIMYVDDISFYKIEEPRVFYMDSDQRFYYSDLESGTARVEISGKYIDSDYTADFKIYDGDEVIYLKEAVDFVDDIAECVFPLGVMTEKKKEYILKVDGKSADGRIIQSQEIPIYIYDRPKMMTRNGKFIVDGKSFVPSILYHPGDESTWPKLHDAGINLLQTTAKGSVEKTREYMDKMHEAGLKVALVLYHSMNPAGHPDNIEYNRQLIEGLKDHPALFCYMTMDEPYIHYGDINYIEHLLAEGYKMIKEIDNVHPVYHCECLPDMYDRAIKFVDVMGIDPYPSNWYSYETHVADMTAKARAVADRYGKGVMQVLQVFTYGGINPDATRVHSMMYQSVMGGAAGNGFYPWISDDYALDPDLGDGQHWQVMTDFYDYEYDIVWGHYAGLEDTVDLLSMRQYDYWIDVWAAEDGVYAAVLNRLANSQRVQIPFEYENITISDCNVSAVNHTLQAEVSDKSFSAVMPAGAAILFKITPGKVSGEAKLQINKMFNRSAAVVCPDNKSRLIIAGYKETAKGTVLADVSVASVSALGFASARLDSTLEYKEVKAFLWR